MEPSNLPEKQNDKDLELWAIAERRANFKWHFIAYCVINGFFLFRSIFDHGNINWKMPFFWGLGLAFHYVSVYQGKIDLTRQEFEKLKRDQELKR